MAQKLIDTVAAVAGAGIGLECARMMVSEGVRGAGRPRRRGGACRLRGAWPGGGPVAVDLTDAADGARMMPQILDRAGRLDIFHANADAYTGGEVVGGDPDAWERMLNLSINAALRSIRAVLPHMVERKAGEIVMTSSIAGLVPVV